MNKIFSLFLDNSHFMCFSDAAENPDQSMENIRVTVQ
jgi:hypothetical protein